MLNPDLRELRAPPEALARWSMMTSLPVQEATYAALAFLAHFEHAATTLLPVPAVVLAEKAVLDSDGFLRQPRGALEHFRLRSERALAWLEQLIFFRERFPAAAARRARLDADGVVVPSSAPVIPGRRDAASAESSNLSL